jgi:hypothetical protein
LLFTNKNDKDQVRFYYKTEGIIELEIKEKHLLYGNLLVQFKSAGSMSTSNLLRITFNTAFISNNNKLECTRWNISPENLHKDF